MPDVQVEIRSGTQWVDITGDVRTAGPIGIERGRPDEATASDPGSCSLLLNNRHGRYSPRNPLSPYFGRIGRNTPLRVSIQGEPHLRIAERQQRARVASSTALDVSDLDVRVEMALDRIPAQWYAAPPDGQTPYSSAGQEIIGRYRIAGVGARMWRLNVNADGCPEVAWSTDGQDVHVLAADEAIPHRPGQRFALRAAITTDDGDGGHKASFWTAPSLAGPWSPLGQPIPGSGTTTIHHGDAPLEVGDYATVGFPEGAGRYYAVELRDGADGPIIAAPDFTAHGTGAGAITDREGNVWEFHNGARLDDRYVRFTGEVGAWPSRWDTSGNDIWVPIEAHGPLRRLGQGQHPLQSTLRRRIADYPGVVAYYPLEDGSGAGLSAASGIPGGAPAATRGLDWAADDSLPGSGPLPTVAPPAALVAPVAIAPEGAWRIEMVYFLPEFPEEGSHTILEFTTTTTPWSRYRAVVTHNALQLHGIDDSGQESSTTMLSNMGIANWSFAGEWNRLYVWQENDGGEVSTRIGWVTIGESGFSDTSTFSGNTGRITQISTVYGDGLEGMTVGHVGVMSDVGAAPYAYADHGYAGESTASRVRRLAQEERLRLTMPGRAPDTQQLGPQLPETYLALIQEAAVADGGVLYELRDTLGALHYAPHHLRYDRAPVVTLDYAAGQVAPPLEPVDDDQDVRNRIVVSRTGGSSVTVERTSGALSTGEPPDGVGVYEDSITLSVATDEQLVGIAGWRLHLGTWDEERYPTVHINLANPRIIQIRQQVLDGLDVGTVLQITNPPPWLPPGDISLVVQGYTETINTHGWDIEATCTPAGPWRTGRVTDPDDQDGQEQRPERADATDSRLVAPIGETDATLWVTEYAGAQWITDAGPVATAGPDLPLDIRAGGEVMTVHHIEPAAWDTYDRDVADGWGTTDSGHTWQIAGGTPEEWHVADGAGHLMLTGDTQQVRGQLLPGSYRDTEILVSITPDHVAESGSTQPGILLRFTGATYYRVVLGLFSDGLVYLILGHGGTTLATAPTPYQYAAGTRVWLRVRITGQHIQARTWTVGHPEPGNWPVSHEVVDDPIPSGQLGILAYASGANTTTDPAFAFEHFEIVAPRRFGVTRSVNGITKSHPEGTSVRLADPIYVAL